MTTERELAAAGSAHDLVPGDPDRLLATAARLQGYADAALRAAVGLRALDTGHWTGAAADRFRDRVAVEPGRWETAAHAFAQAALATRLHARMLDLAQQDAARALARYRDAAGPFGGPVTATLVPGGDPQSPDRAAACRLVDAARADVAATGAGAARSLHDVATRAPTGPSGFAELVTSWARVQQATDAWTWNTVAVPVVNGVVNLQVAADRNPLASLAVVAGIAMVAVGAVGDGAGLALAATGVGAVPGAGVLTASNALAATGVTTLAAAGGVLLHDASRQNIQIVHRGRRLPVDRTDPATTKFDPGTAVGQTVDELEARVPVGFGAPRPATSGIGIVFEDPANRGRTFRFMEGYPAGVRADPRKEFDYVVVSQNGTVSYLFTDGQGVIDEIVAVR